MTAGEQVRCPAVIECFAHKARMIPLERCRPKRKAGRLERDRAKLRVAREVPPLQLSLQQFEFRSGKYRAQAASPNADR